MTQKILLTLSILFFINLFFINNNYFNSQTFHSQKNLSPYSLTNHPSQTNHSSSTFAKKILGIKTAKAENRHMIMIGLEDGGSGGSTWVFDIWKLCMSLINIVLVGILIFLGVVNILHLNYDTYEIKKFLLPLIVSIILANFSLFICRAVVELSSALSETLLKDQADITANIAKGLGFNAALSLVDLSVKIFGDWLGTALIASGGIAIFVATTIFSLIVAIILVLIFLIITLLLYLRVFVVLILAAVSPLAFVAMVIPATQQYFKQWWSWFLRWVFMGPIIVLILKVAAVVGGQDVDPVGSGGMLTMIFIFIGVIGLLILAVLTPFVIGGAMQIPGMKELTGFAKNKATQFAKQNETIQGAAGFFEGHGKKKEEAASTKRAMGGAMGAAIFSAEIKKGKTLDNVSSSFNQGLSDAKDIEKAAIRKKRGNVDVEQFREITANNDALQSMKLPELHATLEILADQGDLDQNIIDNVHNNWVPKNDAEREAMKKTIGNSIARDNNAKLSKNRNPENLDNKFIKDEIERRSQRIKNNQYIENTTTSREIRSRAAEASLSDINYVLSQPDNSSNKDNKELAEKRFHEIETKINSSENPEYNRLKANTTFLQLQSTHGLDKKARSIADVTIKKGNGGIILPINHESHLNAFTQTMTSDIPTEDSSGQTDESAIRKIEQTKQHLERVKVDTSDQNKIAEYINGQNISDKHKETIIINNLSNNFNKLGNYDQTYIDTIIKN